MTTNRAATVSILLAGAALFGGIGAAKTSNGEAATPWFAWAAGALVLALIANLWPASRRLPWWRRFDLYLQRARLRRSPTDGWETGHVSTLKGTLLSLTALPGGKPLTGFHCEVHGPAGVFDAYTQEAKKAILEARGVTGLLAMPVPSTHAFLEFPDEFKTPAGDPLTTVHGLPTGKYHQVWFAWDRAADGISVTTVFVALSSFDFVQVGGPTWRIRLGDYRVRRELERRQRAAWKRKEVNGAQANRRGDRGTG
jgi:hypothetical protein